MKKRGILIKQQLGISYSDRFFLIQLFFEVIGDFVFDPFLGKRRKCFGFPLKHQTIQFIEIVQKLKKLAEVVSNRGSVRIFPLQMFFVDFANAFNALGDGPVKLVSACVWMATIRLKKQKCGTHVELRAKIANFLQVRKFREIEVG